MINPEHHLILRYVARLVIPFVALFGLYVQFHGDFGPGGGFQAGVIMAVTLVLYALIFGLDEAQKAVPVSWLRIGAAAGVLLYAGTGLASLFLGENYLNYTPLHPDVAHKKGQHYGILLIEFGILLAVANTIALLFYLFTERLSDMRDEDW